MDLGLRLKLRALPIWDPATFPLRLAIARFLTISERSAIAAGAIRVALDKLSDTELDEYSQPETIPSISEAVTLLAGKAAQSSEYSWRQHGNCLVLLSRSRFAESLDVPGVAFEFVIRTGRSAWMVYRIPDTGEILDCALYSERNELIAHSRHLSKSSTRARRERPRRGLARLGQAIALALLPSPIRQDAPR